MHEHMCHALKHSHIMCFRTLQPLGKAFVFQDRILGLKFNKVKYSLFTRNVLDPNPLVCAFSGLVVVPKLPDETQHHATDGCSNQIARPNVQRPHNKSRQLRYER